MLAFASTLAQCKCTLSYFKLNKKVLLRERKRHTARCVASTPYVVLTGYPPGQGAPPQPGYPPARVPPRPEYPPGQGTPPARVPPPWPGYPPARVPPLPGYPPRLDLAGYPPGCPMAFWEMLQSIMGYGYPPPRCGQTNKVKLLPSRRTTYAGDN